MRGLGLINQKTILMVKMGKNEDDILLEAEDPVATLELIIADWNLAADNSLDSEENSKQYCLGRAHGLEVCLPLIKQLKDRITKLILEQID